ncbi:MAG TPA: muramidase [Streptomyces sp.]|nr:muramidase [Streptomyces sp.]
MIHGIDVSSHQSSFSTDGEDFVFIKATEGRSYTNPRRAAQAEQARNAGCVVGFYHFLWPGDLSDQARYFTDKCGAEDGDVLAVDWETTSSGTRASGGEKDRFLRMVRELRPDHRVILYCNRTFWRTYDSTSYASDGLWIADYVTKGEPRIEAEWRFHQYTNDPHDKNVGRFADKDALRSWAKPS